ncbi:thioredoxin reductase-like selenoprotein T1a [Folsomia candida]|uniref:thioredoxin reductase-like selenoprotein T1a n=1 Tax=Folsomia candida TaxID=158441 RepID=UPI000B8F8AF6|nr:thioredoxin reductase-like selenoprotein T1a [Folsomia candida]
MADEGGGDNPQIPKSYIYIFIILILFVARDFMNTPMSSTTKGDGRYQNVFQQFSQLLLQRHPEILIEGENYPPLPIKKLGAQIMSIAKFAFLGCLFMGTNPFQILGLGGYAFCLNLWTWMQSNKIYASLMIFFLSNFVENQLISTGAFEIYFNDVPVWSKLQTGRIPSPGELFQIVDNHMKLVSTMDGLHL